MTTTLQYFTLRQKGYSRNEGYEASVTFKTQDGQTQSDLKFDLPQELTMEVVSICAVALAERASAQANQIKDTIMASIKEGMEYQKNKALKAPTA